MQQWGVLGFRTACTYWFLLNIQGWCNWFFRIYQRALLSLQDGSWEEREQISSGSHSHSELLARSIFSFDWSGSRLSTLSSLAPLLLLAYKTLGRSTLVVQPASCGCRRPNPRQTSSSLTFQRTNWGINLDNSINLLVYCIIVILPSIFNSMNSFSFCLWTTTG